MFHYSYLIKLEKELQNEYNAVLAQEKLLWYQKSRENWVKFGNKNTRFFHTQIVIRRRRNKISGLQIDGNWCDDETVLKQEALSFFKKLFISNEPCNPNSLNLQNIPQVDVALSNSLMQPVSMQEVKEALFSMHAYKAPGSDGFQTIFFKTYWEIVGKDVW